MKSKFLFLVFIFFLSSNLHSQSDTIRLVKLERTVYRCTNPDANFWYLYKQSDKFYLVNLTLPEDEIENWFKSYLNSQNLFYSKIYNRNNKEFFRFQKPNNLEDNIIFEILRRSSTEIVTQSAQTGEEFCFKQIEF